MTTDAYVTYSPLRVITAPYVMKKGICGMDALLMSHAPTARAKINMSGVIAQGRCLKTCQFQFNVSNLVRKQVYRCIHQHNNQRAKRGRMFCVIHVNYPARSTKRHALLTLWLSGRKYCSYDVGKRRGRITLRKMIIAMIRQLRVSAFVANSPSRLGTRTI